MAANASSMASELAQSPAAVRGALAEFRGLQRLVDAFGRSPPRLAVMCGRGSSGHAAGFMRYAFETRLGIPVSLMAPSVFTVYGARLRLEGAWFIAISQSGASPDIIATLRMAREGGALTVAIVNDEESVLAREADVALPLRSGPERSVAATKTVIASMALGAQLVAALARDDNLTRALQRLPRRLEAALECGWGEVSLRLLLARRAFVIGRGFSLPVAAEIALKMAEVTRTPAMAWSAAEMLHGPRAAIAAGDLALVLSLGDETASSVERAVESLREGGVRVLVCGGDGGLDWIGEDHAVADAIAMLAPAYAALERCAMRAGYNPDRPPFLSKVTRTL